jgi:hypothetical protein
MKQSNVIFEYNIYCLGIIFNHVHVELENYRQRGSRSFWECDSRRRNRYNVIGKKFDIVVTT